MAARFRRFSHREQICGAIRKAQRRTSCHLSLLFTHKVIPMLIPWFPDIVLWRTKLENDALTHGKPWLSLPCLLHPSYAHPKLWNSAGSVYHRMCRNCSAFGPYQQLLYAVWSPVSVLLVWIVELWAPQLMTLSRRKEWHALHLHGEWDICRFTEQWSCQRHHYRGL